MTTIPNDTMPFDAATLDQHGITAGEYDRIRALLGREPQSVDAALREHFAGRAD